ncbi:unnamed protein product [Linum trigynum]|uniref:Transcription factor TFIIE alpha subunit n=1 Tax=Linum trigynum TaxID=586398 RepID=A0AAV2E4W1_9ROSI
MRKKLKEDSEGKNTIQEYVCPNCGRRYNALDALRLVSMEDESFHCENCNGELVAESDKLTIPEGGDGDDNARRRRREQIKHMLQKMDTHLKPLIEQLNRVKDIAVPEFGNLLAWEARASAAGRARNGSDSNDPFQTFQGYDGAPLPYLGETKVEVAFSGIDGKEEDAKSESAGAALKVFPPWLIKPGMNITEEQRGEVKQESEMVGSLSSGFSDDNKTVSEDDEKKLLQRHELEAANKQQEVLETSDWNGPPESSPQRQVGMKFKREDDEGDDDVDWEEAPMRGESSNYRVHDLNKEAKATPEDEDEDEDDDDDDIDWEEG